LVVHWLVGTLIVVYVPTIGGEGFVLFAAGTVGSALFSLLQCYSIDRPIEMLRTSVKKQGLAQSNAVLSPTG
jgi:hypothetical protein